MRIVEPYAKLLDIGGLETRITSDAGIRVLRKIEFCGRISHRSEDTQSPISWERFIKAVVIEHGDWSIVEHASATVDFLVDRGITHEIVRHRLFSFTQESTRFVNYEKKLGASFAVPPGLSPDAAKAGNGEQVELSQDQLWRHAVDTCESVYKQLIGRGASPQIARSVFPNALTSRLLVTGNLRNWRHFLIMRTTKESHPQMRQVTIPLLQQFKDNIPLLFDDIEPNQKQSLALAKAR